MATRDSSEDSSSRKPRATTYLPASKPAYTATQWTVAQAAKNKARWESQIFGGQGRQ